MRIYKDFNFEAAHYLPDAAAGHPNRRVHGHSFRARVTIDGEPDRETGLVLHFDQMQEAIDAAREDLDHRFLNDIEGLGVPTLERIAEWLWARIADELPGLAEIVIARDSCFEGCVYTGPEAAGKGNDQREAAD